MQLDTFALDEVFPVLAIILAPFHVPALSALPQQRWLHPHMTPFSLSVRRKLEFLRFGWPERYTPGATSEKLIGGTTGGSSLFPSWSANRTIVIVAGTVASSKLNECEGSPSQRGEGQLPPRHAT